MLSGYSAVEARWITLPLQTSTLRQYFNTVKSYGRIDALRRVRHDNRMTTLSKQKK